jgi:hypothetical protein
MIKIRKFCYSIGYIVILDHFFLFWVDDGATIDFCMEMDARNQGKIARAN